MFKLLTKNKQGFTLIESTVAMVILMVGLWSVIQFFPFSLKIIGDAQNLTLASNLAVSQIEAVASEGYDLINTGTIETKGPISSDPGSYLYNYQRETIVEYVDSNFTTIQEDQGLKKITVNVYWLSPIGLTEKSTSIYTLIADF